MITCYSVVLSVSIWRPGCWTQYKPSVMNIIFLQHFCLYCTVEPDLSRCSARPLHEQNIPASPTTDATATPCITTLHRLILLFWNPLPLCWNTRCVYVNSSTVTLSNRTRHPSRCLCDDLWTSTCGPEPHHVLPECVESVTNPNPLLSMWSILKRAAGCIYKHKGLTTESALAFVRPENKLSH